MRLVSGFLIMAVCLRAGNDTAAHRLWDELQAKRAELTALHEEFEVTQTIRTSHGIQSEKRKLVIDMSRDRWREQSLSGSGSFVRIYNGEDVRYMEEAGDEYILTKLKPKEDAPQPSPFQIGNADWSKATELQRKPCGLSKLDHTCVVLRVPVRGSQSAGSPGHSIRALEGVREVCLDVETGLLISWQSVQLMQNERESYRMEISYAARNLNWGGPSDAALFRLPSEGMREVKALSKWNAAKIRKQLGGNPAPGLSLTDIRGESISLSALKGKLVLLDFWTTWCPPCRADAPALDKLYQKYGSKDFTIIGISVSEERAVVEKFIGEHPHLFPVALTSENDMPRAFQIGTFPTYVIIDRDGNVAGAVEGDQGFGELRKLLKKAGLEVD